MNNLTEVREIFPYLNRFICVTKGISTCNRFSFFNILNLNKLTEYFIDANINNKITSKS